MSPKSMRTQRPSRAPSRRTGLDPAARSASSTASTMAHTWRSLDAEAMRKMSVRARWSLTSIPATSMAFLSSAAVAAMRASSNDRSVAGTGLLDMVVQGTGVQLARIRGGSGVQVVLVYVLDDPVGHEVPDGFPVFHPCPAVGRADRHGRNLQEGDPVLGQALVAQHMPRAGDADEVCEVEQPLGILPGQDLGQGVGTGDEEQLGVEPLGPQV